jgi:long-chain acyl-CoA synthetase
MALFDPETGLVKGWSGYIWESYATVSKRRLEFGRGLDHLYTKALNRSPADKWHLGIFSINRPEWVIADLGAQLFSLVTVALYDTLGPETSEFIINHSELPMIVTSLDKVGHVFQILPKCPTLKVIIVMDDNFPALKKAAVAPLKVYEQWAREKGIILLTFGQVEELGRKHLVEPRRPTPEDLLSICYTSGNLNSFSLNKRASQLNVCY